MVRTSCVCIALALLHGSFVLGNTITNVEVNGSVSGGGNILLRCNGPLPGCFEIPMPGTFRQIEGFTFSRTNTQLGSFFGFGQAMVDGTPAIESSGFQSATTTGDSLSIDLISSWRASPPDFFGSGKFVSNYNVGVNNNISVAFDLTVESLLQLDAPPGTQLFDSHGNSVLAITSCCSTSALLQELINSSSLCQSR